MIKNDVSFGSVDPDRFSINKKELSARIGQVDVGDKYDHLIDRFNASAKYRFAYTRSSLIIKDGACIFDCGSVKSDSLSRVLCRCKEVIFLAVSAGIDSDRLLQRATIKNNYEAFLLDAIGSAMIESFADHINMEIAKEICVTKRFSPGYSDFPLKFQKTLLDRLNADSTVGISLSDELLMTPMKSITAVIGIL